MVRIIGVPAPPPGGQIGFGVNAPPPGGTVSGDCACVGLGVVWHNGTEFAVAVDTDTTSPSFAITGTICPGTTYTITPSWEPDASGAEPIVQNFGASAWTVLPPIEGGPYDDGVLTVSVTAICGGLAFALGPIFLTIIPGTYTVDCVPPTEYATILSVASSGCIHAQKHGVVDDIVFTVFDSFLINDGPFYQNPGTIGTVTGINFDGLRELFGDADMAVRVTVFSNDLANDGGYPIYVDNRNSDDDDVGADATWEYTVANADIDDWYTGAGCGNGAGGTGSCEFSVEIKVA